MSNGAMVKSLYEAAARGEGSVMMAALHPAIEWFEAEGSPYAKDNPFVGPAAVGALLMRIGADIADFRLAPERFTDGGDVVVVEGRYTGRGANGTPFDAQFAHVWRVRDGQVVHFQQYTDTRQWAHALGAD